MRLERGQTFETFVSGTTSAAAFGLASALAQAQPDAPRLLLLCGPPGVGKTHLLRAIVERARRRFPRALIAEMTAAELIERMLARLAAGASTFHLQPAAWLVVDDLHVLSGKTRTQVEVGCLLRTVVERGGRVACASGGPVSRIQVLADAVRRLSTARIVELGPPTPREMRRIVVKRASALGLPLRGTTTARLADHGRGDVRRAIGGLTRLQFQQTLRTGAGLV